jgi:hypothetical protein
LLVLGRPQFGPWFAAVPKVEDHHRLLRILGEVTERLPVERIVSSEQHRGRTELRCHVRPGAVNRGPAPDPAREGLVVLPGENPIGL